MKTKTLTALACIGVVTTAVVSGRATLKAEKVLQELDVDKLKRMECKDQFAVVAKKILPNYIPVLAVGGATVMCMATSHTVDTREAALFAAAYSTAETAFDVYKDKVVEKLGQKTHDEIVSDICEDEIYDHPASESTVIQTGTGNTLCYDSQSGRYFMSNIDSIRKAEVAVAKALPYGEVTLNDFYERIGLDGIKLGDQLGWDADRKYPDIHFDSILSDDGTPCLVIKYDVVILSDYLIW